VQKVYEYGNIYHIPLTANKELNILIYAILSASSCNKMNERINKQKTVLHVFNKYDATVAGDGKLCTANVTDFVVSTTCSKAKRKKPIYNREIS